MSMACQVPSSNTGTQPNANTGTAQATPVQTPDQKMQASDSVFTLPMLDALLADESFTSEAKRSVPITDEELERLRDISRKAVADLSDEDTDDSRSSRAATEQARTKIEAILGNDRTQKLIALAQQAGSTDAGTSSKPGSVPTDTRVVVNAPEYRMDVFKDGKLIKSYKIGIGYPEFPLPSGLRKASTIIFNPTWTPPDEPWVKGKVKAGEKVEAGDKLNPLGPIKIPIGLPSLIHGGKSPARLGTFASHGCVGLTNGQVQDFAVVLSSLAGEPLSQDQIKSYEKAKTQTKEVKLGQPVPVELRYETIVVEDGVLKIFRDVYEKGTNTEENLAAVLSAYGVTVDSLDPQLKSKILDALKQMATDAQGHPADPSSSNASNSGSKGGSNSNSGSVTRTIKGKKEIDIPIPQLTGKGYPAPVAMKMQ
ncbi:MAG TPA: L,D-transpeptidase [Pyrinomonadaceae bacterium]|nr:L,D-transpeptidase [Pyrinomonadaceae bacterium]